MDSWSHGLMDSYVDLMCKKRIKNRIKYQLFSDDINDVIILEIKALDLNFVMVAGTTMTLPSKLSPENEEFFKI